jgi:hypothetical protein
VALLVTLTFGIALAQPLGALAKDFALIAIVDCGVKSGKPCPDGTTVIGVRTDQISGKLQTYKVDVGWVLKQAPSLHQDDEICVEVRDNARTDGILQAIAFIDKCDGPAPRVRKGEDDVVVASDAEAAPQVTSLLCNFQNGQGQGTTGTSTTSTFVVQMFTNDGFAGIEFNVTSGTVRFRILYEGNEVLDTGFRSGPDTELYSFGPGTATTVTLETTLGSPGSFASFEMGCPLTA